MHSDSDGRVDDRCLSAIMYLNESWDKQDGGQLRMYPFPLSRVPIDIDPIAGRLVIFSSIHMVHRVLPSYKKRHCFTLWFSKTSSSSLPPATNVAAMPSPPPGFDTLHTVEEKLVHPKVHKHVLKLYYAQVVIDVLCRGLVSLPSVWLFV